MLEIDRFISAGGDVCSHLVGQGTSLLADRVAQYGSVVDSVAITLRKEGEPQAADVAKLLGSRAKTLARYLRAHDGRALLEDFRSFAEGRPWMAAGIGVLGGLALARAVRTSMQCDG